jgi:hypothetical protein
VNGTSVKGLLLYWRYPLRVVSEIFGAGRPARFHTALSIQQTQRALQAVLSASSSAKNSVSLVGGVVDDQVRIQSIIRRDGTVKRNYTCFAGRIIKIDAGCELVGSFVVPLHGKFLIAVPLLAALIFATSDFFGSIAAEPNFALLFRGPGILLGTIITIPYLFGLDRQQVDEITTQIGQVLRTDGQLSGRL